VAVSLRTNQDAQNTSKHIVQEMNMASNVLIERIFYRRFQQQGFALDHVISFNIKNSYESTVEIQARNSFPEIFHQEDYDFKK
jgi:hypothetical protein